MNWLSHPTRFIFFTGKGGVGKTSISTAIAITLADAGKRVLLVSTDAASNLDEMLNVELSNQPVKVPGVKGLELEVVLDLLIGRDVLVGEAGALAARTLHAVFGLVRHRAAAASRAGEQGGRAGGQAKRWYGQLWW